MNDQRMVPVESDDQGQFDKSRLKRLVTQVFGEGYQIVPPSAPVQSVPDWRPIETAPKSTADGDHVHGIYIIGFCPEPDMCNLESAVCVVWWEPLMKGGAGMWYGEGGYETKPTHWMPLPQPPKEATAQSVACPTDKEK